MEQLEDLTNYKYENAIIIGRVGAYYGSINYSSDKFWASDNMIVVKNKAATYLALLFRLRIITA